MTPSNLNLLPNAPRGLSANVKPPSPKLGQPTATLKTGAVPTQLAGPCPTLPLNRKKQTNNSQGPRVRHLPCRLLGWLNGLGTLLT